MHTTMKREIIYGEKKALLSVVEGRAILSIESDDSTLKLADAIDGSDEVEVDAVYRKENGEAVIRINHTEMPFGLLETVCESISQVYEVDTKVFFARS